MIWFVILSIATIIYFFMASKQDIKERRIYTVPVIVIHALWSIYLLCMTDYTSEFLCVFWMLHLMLYILLNVFQIWGGGDSDLFLLFADLCLIAGPMVSAYTIAIRECLFLAVGLAIAIGVGYVDFKIRGEKMESKKDIAVAPGFAVVTLALIMKGLVWRLM